jgi:hypothetical protein
LGFAFGQTGSIVLTNGYIVESGGVSKTQGAYIVISNGSNSALAGDGVTTSTSGPVNGWIVSESEFNMVRWFINENTGSYTVPFGSSGSYNLSTSAALGGVGYSIPVTINIGTKGINGGGSAWIDFSTYHTLPLNSNFMPSDVKDMAPAVPSNSSPSTTDDSYEVIDRFWIVDATQSYGTKPALNGITFSYLDSNVATYSEAQAPNIPGMENFLLAQRYNPTLFTKGYWGDFYGMAGTDVIAGNTGSANSGPVGSSDFYRSWTLSSSNSPLPIDISAFKADCDNGTALIQWTSLSELNNAYYTVTKTMDNIHFETVGTIKGAGTTSQPTNYSLTDYAPFPGTSYYFLSQTDFDNTTTQVSTIPFSGCASNPTTTIYAYNTTNSSVIVQINSVAADNFNISLVNMLGQTITSQNHAVALGSNQIPLNFTLSPGIYIINVKNDKYNYSKKLSLGIK